MELDQIEQLLAARRKIGSGTARGLREAAGLTQADMAKLIGVGPSALSRLEAGNRQPRPETLIRWAHVLTEIEKRLQRAAKRTA